MYGLLLMNMQEYVEKVFGAKKWVEIKEALKIKVTDLYKHIRLITSVRRYINLIQSTNNTKIKVQMNIYFRKKLLVLLTNFQKVS